MSDSVYSGYQLQPCGNTDEHSAHAWLPNRNRVYRTALWCEGVVKPTLADDPTPEPDDTPDEGTRPKPIDWEALRKSWADMAANLRERGKEEGVSHIPPGLKAMADTYASEMDAKAARFAELPKYIERANVLSEAITLITGDRNNAYGPPSQDFKRSADAMTAFGFRVLDTATGEPMPIQRYHVALMVDLIKTSRLMHSPLKRDSWVDKGGYAGCGYEAALADAADEDPQLLPEDDD